jgi:ABC-type tungstate transport system permease subunit
MKKFLAKGIKEKRRQMGYNDFAFVFVESFPLFSMFVLLTNDF